jgi:hypothetical protein
VLVKGAVRHALFLGDTQREIRMQIRIGYELTYECPQPTPMILTLNVHFSRVSDLVTPDHIVTSPPIPITAYRDRFLSLHEHSCALLYGLSG